MSSNLCPLRFNVCTWVMLTFCTNNIGLCGKRVVKQHLRNDPG